MNKKFKLLSAIALSSVIGMSAAFLPACSKDASSDGNGDIVTDGGTEDLFPDVLPDGEQNGGTEEEGNNGGSTDDSSDSDGSTGGNTGSGSGGSTGGNTGSGSGGSTGGNTGSGGSQTTPQQNKVGYVAVIAANVNIRSGASTDHSVLGQAKKSTLYAIVGKIGNWYITYYQNKLGYIYSDYCQTVYMTPSSDQRVESVISDATKLLGVKYVYGAVRYHDGYGNRLSGFSVYAFDCSSLLQYAFKTGANYNLQVTTRTQVKQGKTVAASQLKRGDLMFFTNSSRYYNTGVERIGHVALYLGDNYILHTSSEFAKIEKISTSRWNYYIQSQRIF